MKVGAAPPRRKREKQEIDQSMILNKTTIKKKGRRKRTKKKIKIDDDDEEKSNVSASLFAQTNIMEEKEDLPATPKAKPKTSKSLFDELDDENDIDDILVKSVTKPKQEIKPKKKGNIFGDESSDDDDPWTKKPEPKVEKKEEIKPKKKDKPKDIFKQSGIGGGMDLFDDESDDDGFVKFKKNPKIDEKITGTQVKKIQTKKTAINPLADSDDDGFQVVDKKEEPKKEKTPEPKQEIVPEKKPEPIVKQSPKSTFKKKGKLSKKFGHLNFDPTKMMVGAGPPRKKKAFQGDNVNEPKKKKDESIFDEAEEPKREDAKADELDSLFDEVPQKPKEKTPQAKVVKKKVKVKEPSPSPEPEIVKKKPKEVVKETTKASTNIFDMSDSDEDDIFAAPKKKNKLKNQDDDIDGLFD
eukprot:284777_1